MITIVSYQAAWQAEFMRLGRHLRQHLGNLALRIDHIGSTAVPGLAAKDIIDIQITAQALTPTLENALTLAGYQRLSHITQDHVPPGKHDPADDWLKWLFKPATAQRPVNVHIRLPGRANQRYALLFRDYLWAYPAIAQAYAQVKMGLAKYYPGRGGDECVTIPLHASLLVSPCDIMGLTFVRSSSFADLPLIVTGRTQITW